MTNLNAAPDIGKFDQATLPVKQARFVEEYLVDLNATQAAIRAGYSRQTAKQQGSRLLTNDDVQAAISRAQAVLSKKTGITIERIVSELAAIGFARITDVVKWTSAEVRFEQDGAGRGPAIFAQPAHFIQLRKSDELSAASAAAISRIGIGKEGEIKIKMHDKLAALVALGKHLGMFK